MRGISAAPRIWLLAATLAIGGCSFKNTAGLFEALEFPIPDAFLTFFNPQPDLGVGDYQIVAATNAVGESGSFTVTVRYDNGTTQTFTGSWSPSGGQNPASIANPTFNIEMTRAGGLSVTLTSSTADAYLYLLDHTGATGVVAEDNNSGGGTNAAITLTASQINDAAYTTAYYTAVDAANTRATLSDWKTTNGFGTACPLPGVETHVIFRDTRDLGYGRDMYMRHNCDGFGTIAFYVQNFQVTTVPGAEYGPLNLDAAIEQNFRHHVGTNAIEYRVADGFLKFFNFNPTTGARQIAVDLDGRGAKSMPQPCITCHGGRADPLVRDSTGAMVFPRSGDVKAKFNGFEVDTFGFSTTYGSYTRYAQEAALKLMNQAVLCSYPLPAPTAFLEDACRMAAVAGEWQGTSADLIKAWYGGDGMPNATFSDTYVPAGWQPDPNDGNPPPGADTLYRKVVAQRCRACHSLRGTGNQDDIDFNTYAKFIGHVDRIEPLIYDRGKMPLSQLTFQAFWDAGTPREADLLASFIPGFSRVDGAGNVLEPGRPVANPGPAHTTISPVKLSAAASLFATTYNWSIVSQPVCGSASLTNATSSRPTLTGCGDGDYVVRLVVGNGTTSSAPADVTITIDSALVPAPAALTFTTHIKPIVQGTCLGCHISPGGVAGIPVFYNNFDRDGDGDTDPDDDHELFRAVRARVDLTDPVNSLLLRKPSNNHHNGSLQTGFDLAGNRTNYDTILNWILNGAVE